MRKICTKLTVILCLVFAAQTAMAAMVVTVTGQAVNTGSGGADQTRRRALDDALYQAAFKGGASVDGITVIDNAVLQVNQTRIKPKAHVLDYAIVKEHTENGFFQLTIKAVVGDMPKPALCARRSQLHIVQYAPQLQLDPRLPAKMGAALSVLEDGYFQGLGNSLYLNRVAVHDATKPLQNKPRIRTDFDYTSLTRGTPAQVTPNGDEEFTVTAAIALRRGELPNGLNTARMLTLDMTAHINAPAKYGAAKTLRLSKDYKYAYESGSQTFDILSKPDVQNLTQMMQGEIATALRSYFDDVSCAPLRAKLQEKDGQLIIPFGRENGIQPGWLAYAQSKTGHYTVLELKTLGQNNAQLRPLNPQTGIEALNGQDVSFMALDG